MYYFCIRIRKRKYKKKHKKTKHNIMKAIENIASIYNKFYELLYNGIIDEDTINLNVVRECIKTQQREYKQLCEELQDIPFSDREQAAFYLTMNFIFA